MSRKAKRRLTLKPIAPKPAAHKPQTNPLSKAHFLHTEDEGQFCVLLSEYVETYNPQYRDEYDLLTEAVYAKWRQQRYWLAESGQIELAIARNEATLRKEVPRADAAAHLANGVAHSEDMMRLYLRYNNQLHRQYLRCLKELRDLQAERQPPPGSPDDLPKEATPKIEHPGTLPEYQPAAAPVPTETGSVPTSARWCPLPGLGLSLPDRKKSQSA
jgi:hypothetical protein